MISGSNTPPVNLAISELRFLKTIDEFFDIIFLYFNLI